MSNQNNFEFEIRSGARFTTGKTTFIVVELDDSEVILRAADSGESRHINIEDLLFSYVSGKIQFIGFNDDPNALVAINDNNISTLLRGFPQNEISPAQTERFLEIKRLIEGMKSLGYSCFRSDSLSFQHDLNKLSKSLGYKKPLKASTLYKWSLILEQSDGDIRSILPRYDLRGGKGKCRTDESTNNAINAAITENLNNKKSRMRTKDILSDAQRIYLAQNPDTKAFSLGLNWSTVDRRIKQSVPAYTLCVRKKGKAAAKRLYRTWYPRDRATMPLEVAETDDTDTKIFLFDRKSGLPYGRGWLTSVLDQESRALMGWETSIKPRSVWSALSSVTNAILPKDPKSDMFSDCECSMEFFGRPGIIVFDNALYNHANAIELAAAEMHFTAAWAKPKTPTEKSDIEGWHKKLKQEFLPTVPGWRGSLAEKEGLSEGMASANCELHEFQRLLAKWICDDYSSTPIGTDPSPREAWRQGLRYTKARVPLDINGLKISAFLPYKKKLRPEGILFSSLTYCNQAIQDIRMKYGYNAEVKFKYNPGNLGTIYVFEPQQKKYIPVRCNEYAYAEDLTLFQQKLILKLAHENKVKMPTIKDLLHYREQLRDLTHQLRISKKIKERKIAIRTGDIPLPKGKLSDPPLSITSEMQTELEYTISEIETITFELDNEEWEIPDDF